MRQRQTLKFRPAFERLDQKQLLSAGGLTSLAHSSRTSALHPLDRARAHGKDGDLARAQAGLPTRFLAFRITNTSSQLPVDLVPPFQQDLVQSRQPVAGQVYNVLDVAVKNGTSQTFTAGNHFTVRMTNQPQSLAFPILTGAQQWQPKQWIVLYILTKKYYPVSPVGGGFQLDTGGRSSTLVPGPSGIFLRLTYNPATFAKTLNWIVAYGPGAEGGAGAKVGLPDTAINELVAARTHRIDYGGHF
jgi:hypothetical protein